MLKPLPAILNLILISSLSACIHSRNVEPNTQYKVSKNNYSFFIENRFSKEPLKPAQEVFLKQQHHLLKKSNWKLVKTNSLRYLEKHPYDELALSYLSIAVYQLGFSKLATYYTDLLLSLNESDAIALNIKGLITIKNANVLHDYRLAISLFLKAMESNQDEVAAGLNLGYTYLSLGNSTKAGKVFRHMSKRCNNCQVAETGNAISLMRLGKSQDAMSILKDLTDKNPNNLVAKYELARYYFRVGRKSADANKILREVFENTNKNDRKEVLKRAKMLWNDQNRHNLF
ncbi:MAG: tetratricopeptide repeat protein [Oligoflexales bacterium]